jgi:predicted dehydrogenase
MALILDEAQCMTEVAETNGVQWLCGHTVNLMTANQAMRRLITSGEVADVRTSMSGRIPTEYSVHV